MTHNYEYKYLKYKAKYNELKKNTQMGADNMKIKNDIKTNKKTNNDMEEYAKKMEKQAKNILHEFVNSFIIPLYLETKCCYNDLRIISSKNNYQKIYIEIIKDELLNYMRRQETIFMNYIVAYVSKPDRMNIYNALQNYSTVIENINWMDYIVEIVIPLIYYIVKNYRKMYNNIKKKIAEKGIPFYKIKYVKDLNRTDKRDCLIISDSNVKCCDSKTNASNCIDYIINTRIGRALYILDELYKISPHQIQLKIHEIHIIVGNIINDKMDEEKKNYQSDDSILTKLKNKIKYGGIEITPIVNKK